MYNISGLNFITAPLSEEKKERGPEKGRLMLVDLQDQRRILWLTPEEQTKARKSGARLSENLEAIARALPHVIANSRLDKNCAPILLKNISWINQRIESHNEKLANSKLRSFFSKILAWFK